jgi:deoxyribonuclease V
VAGGTVFPGDSEEIRDEYFVTNAHHRETAAPVRAQPPPASPPVQDSDAMRAESELGWVVWPEDAAELEELQRRLAAAAAAMPPWLPSPDRPWTIGAVYCAHRRGEPGPGVAGEALWLGAALMRGETVLSRAALRAKTGSGYIPGLLALREGAALEAAARALRPVPDVLLVDATGRDHPRACGLALHLGARLGIPTVGVTDRPLVARGPAPDAKCDSSAELRLDGIVVGYQLRSAAGTRPICVHSGWRTTPETALAAGRLAARGHRTPEPLREARRIARTLRDEDAHAKRKA